GRYAARSLARRRLRRLCAVRGTGAPVSQAQLTPLYDRAACIKPWQRAPRGDEASRPVSEPATAGWQTGRLTGLRISAAQRPSRSPSSVCVCTTPTTGPSSAGLRSAISCVLRRPVGRSNASCFSRSPPAGLGELEESTTARVLEPQPAASAWERCAAVIAANDEYCRGLLVRGLDEPPERIARTHSRRRCRSCAA